MWRRRVCPPALLLEEAQSADDRLLVAPEALAVIRAERELHQLETRAEAEASTRLPTPRAFAVTMLPQPKCYPTWICRRTSKRPILNRGVRPARMPSSAPCTDASWRSAESDALLTSKNASEQPGRLSKRRSGKACIGKLWSTCETRQNAPQHSKKPQDSAPQHTPAFRPQVS